MLLDLHCPNCGYNLTGLPENRCPECGERFSPAELRWRARAGIDNVSSRELIVYLFSAPVAVWLLAAARIHFELPRTAFTACLPLIAALAWFNAIRWTLRATEPDRQSGKFRLLTFIAYLGTALLLQAVIAGGPCGVFRM